MSNQNVMAPSATILTESGNSEQAYPFNTVLSQLANIAKKNLVRGGSTLNRTKLISAMCAQYRYSFSAIYGKGEVLPTDIHAKICESVDNYIHGELSNNINSSNSVSLRRTFAWNEKEMTVFEKVTAIGHNVLALKEQRLGITIFIGQCEKRLKELEAKPNPDFDLEKAVKDRLFKLNVTKQYIESEIAKQATLTAV